MRYAIDTNVLRELRLPRGNAAVKAAVAAIPEDDLFISAVVIGESWRGVAQAAPGPVRDDLAEWTAYLEVRFASRLLSVDVTVARRWGELTGRLAARGRTLPTADGQIAATCLVHDLTLLTRNVADFADTGVRVVDPWTTSIA